MERKRTTEDRMKMKTRKRQKVVKKGKEKDSSAASVPLERIRKYRRKVMLNKRKLKNSKDKKLKAMLMRTDKFQEDAAIGAARAELILPEEAGYLVAEEMEHTQAFTQEKVAEEVDIQTARKMFNLDLDFGPYRIDYTRNGRHLLFGGQKGHLALLDWSRHSLKTEFHVKELCRDVKFLHNETMFAVAQKKNVFVYDNTGLEIHCLKNHRQVNRLEFLPYHFLLTSINNSGRLRYLDVSTGAQVVEHATKLGPCSVMAQNPYNAVICLGHSRGIVTMWTPNMTQPAVKMLCHRGAVTGLGVCENGNYMCSTGADGSMKIWDIRKYETVCEYSLRAAATAVSISQKNNLAISFGPHVQIWGNNVFSAQKTQPYMKHICEGSVIDDLMFCPFEDFLGVGHKKGFSSLVVPGSGEPNYDTFSANIFETKKQRQESEVHRLLEKLPHSLISLDPNVLGKVDTNRNKKTQDDNNKTERKSIHEVKKARGKNRATRRYMKKQFNVFDEKKLRIQNAIDKRKQLSEKEGNVEPLSATLDRFNKK